MLEFAVFLEDIIDESGSDVYDFYYNKSIGGGSIKTRDKIVAMRKEILKYIAKVLTALQSSRGKLFLKCLIDEGVKSFENLKQPIDEKDQKVYQQIVKDVLKALSSDNKEILSNTNEALSNTNEVLSHVRELEKDKVLHWPSEYQIKKHHEINDSLTSKLRRMDVEEDQESRKVRKLVPGTCEWIGTTKKYTDWIDGSLQSSFLWICGLPGQGKSHIATCVKNKLNDNERSVVLSYFFDAQNILSSSEHTMVLSLLRQLLESKRVDEKRYKFYEILGSRRGDSDPLSDNPADRWYYLKRMIEQVPPSQEVYLVLDGLDECYPNPKTLVRKLETLCGDNARQNRPVKIFISS